MRVKAIKTRKLKAPKDDLLAVIEETVTVLENNSVLCVASKVVSIHQGRTIPLDEFDNRDLRDKVIESEAELTMPRDTVPGGYVRQTITQGSLAPSAGIDRSNGNGYAILWPENPSKFAAELRESLLKKFSVANLGVIITDSRSQPLRYGTTGYAIGGAGLNPYVRYGDEEDLFGRPFGYQRANNYDGLAAAATVVMGEGSESTPLAVITDLPAAIEFSDEKHFDVIKIPLEEDVYWPLLKDFE